MKWSDEERQGFLSGLNVVKGVMVTLYRLLLGLIIIAVMAVVVLVVLRRPWGDGNQGEWFYFSVAVLLVLGWAVGQLISLGGRRRKAWLPTTFHSDTSNGTWTWQFRIGPSGGEPTQNAKAGDNNIPCGFSGSFTVPLAALQSLVPPSEDLLVNLEQELRRGVPIDEACRLVQPAFAAWNEQEREAYCRYVTNLLNQPSGTGRDCGPGESRGR